MAKRKRTSSEYLDSPGFIGDAGRMLFSNLTLPTDVASSAVLICSSIHGDHQVNYRREVLLARAFASRGVAVLRFDYRGTGNSDGHPQDLTADTMIEDVETALSFLVRETGIDKPSLMATRLGALIALSLPATGAPLILWEPVLDAAVFWREAFRAQAMHRLKESGSPAVDLAARLDRDGVVDVMGYPIYKSTYASTSGIDVGTPRFARGTPVLLAQIGKNKKKTRELEQTALRWDGLGAQTTLVSVGADEAWWFFGDGQAAAEDLVKTSQDWLLANRSHGDDADEGSDVDVA